jgi:hypothetical protein
VLPILAVGSAGDHDGSTERGVPMRTQLERDLFTTSMSNIRARHDFWTAMLVIAAMFSLACVPVVVMAIDWYMHGRLF